MVLVIHLEVMILLHQLFVGVLIPIIIFTQQTHAVKKGVDLTADFHVYGLVWNETYIGTYFDNESNVVLSVPINESFWSKTGLTSPPWDTTCGQDVVTAHHLIKSFI